MKRLVYITRGNFKGMTGEIISQGTKKRAGKMWYFAEVEVAETRKRYYWRWGRAAFTRLKSVK